MMKFKEFIIESFYNDLHRIDHDNIPKFYQPSSRTYIHTKIGDTEGSGAYPSIKNPPVGYSKFKATYAAEPKLAAPYAIPRHIPWVHHEENGKQIIAISKEHLEEVKSARPTLTIFSSKNFERHNESEYISKSKQGLVIPKKQIEINPLEHLKKHGYTLKTVDNIEKYARKMHKIGNANSEGINL